MDEDYKLFVWFEIWKWDMKTIEKGLFGWERAEVTKLFCHHPGDIEWIEYFRLNNWTIEYNQNLWNPKVELTQLFCHYSECRSTQMFTSSQHNEFWPKFRTAFKTCNVRPRWQTRAQSLPWGESKFVPKKNKKEKNRKKNNKQQEGALDRK